jgi:hypothetical protein
MEGELGGGGERGTQGIITHISHTQTVPHIYALTHTHQGRREESGFLYSMT